jgi:hypothetical protein
MVTFAEPSAAAHPGYQVYALGQTLGLKCQPDLIRRRCGNVYQTVDETEDEEHGCPSTHSDTRVTALDSRDSLPGGQRSVRNDPKGETAPSARCGYVGTGLSEGTACGEWERRWGFRHGIYGQRKDR